MTQFVVIPAGWLMVIADRKTKIQPSFPPPGALKQPSVATCDCVGAMACQVCQWNDKVLLCSSWHIICLHPHLAAVSSKTHTVHFKHLKKKRIHSTWSRQLGSLLFPVISCMYVWTRPVFCTSVCLWDQLVPTPAPLMHGARKIH